MRPETFVIESSNGCSFRRGIAAIRTPYWFPRWYLRGVMECFSFGFLRVAPNKKLSADLWENRPSSTEYYAPTRWASLTSLTSINATTEIK
jgi:hypothetical protein